jgi:hypothetical protein
MSTDFRGTAGGDGIVYADNIIVGGSSLPVKSGTSYFVDGTNGSNNNTGASWEVAKATIAAAITAASAGDTIYIAPGSYDEQVTVSKAKLTLVGAGNRGTVAVAPSASNPTAVKVTVDDVTLINIGCEGDGTGGGLHLQGDVDRFRAYGCKIEGGAFAAKLESTASGAVSDTRFDDCEFAWTGTAIHFVVTGGGDPVTQTYIKKCLFHNYTAAAINVDTTHTADLWVEDCFFGRQEDGTEPTDYILANVASTTGFFSGNMFATATNATGVLTIASGVIWSANATEAGWSTARPA